MKVSDVLCISLCIIVSQVTLIHTGGMGVLYHLSHLRKKGGVRIKVKKKIALRYHICTILNPFIIFAIQQGLNLLFYVCFYVGALSCFLRLYYITKQCHALT